MIEKGKKYFVTSDLHSFYTPFKASLDAAHFDISNPDHILIVCGDLFDRGPETNELFNFLMTIPKSRRIFIRGNHEQLYLDLLAKPFPDSYDFSNGTVSTFCQIANFDENCLKMSSDIYAGKEYREKEDLITSYWVQICKIVKNHKITKFLISKEWKSYYELDKYIFVHSFIPTCLKPEYSIYRMLPSYYWQEDWLQVDPNWRNAMDYEWKEATWGCPWRLFKEGLFEAEAKTGKVLVVGHWHVSEFHTVFENDYNPHNFNIYFGKHLIGLDACTASIYSGQVNVMVIDDQGICYQYNKPLKVLGE